MVKITDSDALDKEGAAWKALQEEHPTRPFGFFAFQAEYHLWEQAEMTDEFIENLHPDGGDGCIYGADGYNRYAVRNTREILFLWAMASRPEKIEEAKRAGFTVR